MFYLPGVCLFLLWLLFVFGVGLPVFSPVSFEFSCQYQYKWLPERTRLWNDLLCAEWTIKLYRCYNTPLFIGPHVKWLPHTGALTWKPPQGTKLNCLVNRGTLVTDWCEQLAQGRCPSMQRPGIEPTICPSRVQCPNYCKLVKQKYSVIVTFT